LRPENISYEGNAEHLSGVWLALRVALRQVFETMSLADVLTGGYSEQVNQLLTLPDANVSRPVFATD
jgi:hypothetical protein